MAVTHSKVSAVADGGDTDLVRPSDWNADHDVTLTAADVGAAPDSVDYLVGTASGGLSGEIAVGTSPGGELGGTWASPTVDATHSGSAHHTQSHDHSAAGDGQTLSPVTLTPSGSVSFTNDETSTLTGSNDDVTLAAGTAVFRWNGASDATFTGLTGGSDGRLLLVVNVTTARTLTLSSESGTSTAGNRFAVGQSNAPIRARTGIWLVYDSTLSRWVAASVHTEITSGPSAIVKDSSSSAGVGATASASDHNHNVTTTDAPSGANITIDAAATAAATGAIARAAHGHRMNTAATNPVALGAADPGTSGLSPSRGDHVHPTTGLITTSTTAAGDLSGTYPNPKVAKSSQSFQMSGEETSTLTGSNNDVAIASTTNVLRWDGASSVTFTGLATGSVGRIVILDNVSTSNLTVTLKHDDAGSTTTNRFYLPGAATLVLYRNEAAVLRYENSTGRWKVLHAPTSAATPAAIGTASAGTAGNAPSRDDHVHATGASTPIAIGTAAIGTGPAAAMTDHVHPTGAGTPSTQAFSDAAATGTGPAAAMTDHKHGMPAGSLNPHGIADHTDVARSFFIPTRGFSGSSFTATDVGTAATLGTAPDSILVGALADAATQGHMFLQAMPSDAKASTAISIRPVWSPGSTDASSHTVRWSVDAIALAAGGDVDSAGTTTAFTGASAARTATIMVIDTATQILSSTSAGDILRINVRRVGADAADTYVGVVNLLGVFIDYTATQ